MTSILSALNISARRMQSQPPIWQATVSGPQYRAVAETVQREGGRLIALWGSDDREHDAVFSVHAALAWHEGMIWMRMQVKESRPIFPNLADIFPVANRMQRAIYDLLGLRDLRQRLQPRIRDGHNAEIRLDGAKRIILRWRLMRARHRIEQSGFSHIRQPDNPSLEHAKVIAAKLSKETRKTEAYAGRARTPLRAEVGAYRMSERLVRFAFRTNLQPGADAAGFQIRAFRAIVPCAQNRWPVQPGLALSGSRPRSVP